MDPLPTPFDIAPVPGVPFTPSLLLWLIVLGLLLIPCILVVIIGRRSSRKPLAPITLATRQLKELALESTTKQIASEAALILKRLLAAQFGLAVEALSGEELTRMGMEERSELARVLAPLIGELDQVRFSASEDGARIQALLNQAISVLLQEERE